MVLLNKEPVSLSGEAAGTVPSILSSGSRGYISSQNATVQRFKNQTGLTKRKVTSYIVSAHTMPDRLFLKFIFKLTSQLLVLLISVWRMITGRLYCNLLLTTGFLYNERE